MKKTTTRSAAYREPDLERAMVKILSQDEERQRFLHSREQYVEDLTLSATAKDVLLGLSRELVNNAAAQFDVYLQVAAQTPVNPRTAPCEVLTLPENFCDG